MSFIMVLLVSISSFGRAFVIHRRPFSRILRMFASEDLTATVILEKGKAKLFQDGNPLIYGGAVKEIIGDPNPGDECVVVDHMNNPLGRGFYNPLSQYRVRIIARSYEKDLMSLSLENLLVKRFSDAISLRRQIYIPNANTSVYRLLNGEGDRLSGFIVDILGDKIVAQSSAFWVEKHRNTILSALHRAFNDDNVEIIWRQSESRLKQDGWEEFNKNNKNLNDKNNDISKTSIVCENSVKYVINPYDGQKTGFYCDQRDNRYRIRNISSGTISV